MSPQLGGLVSPWQHPTPHHASLPQQSLPTTTWQVRKPLVAGDLQSTSTVTTSASPSSSSTSTPPASNTPSPLSTSKQTQLPTQFQFEEYQHLDTPPHSPAPQSQTPRTLPRCGVVNFRKDGDSLRWAPIVNHNASGVAARVHNFEDAFSLEEFSSRALPVVWRSKGGNPRLSDITKSDMKEVQLDARPAKSGPRESTNVPPQSAHTTAKRSSQPVEKRTKSLAHSERAMVRNSSVKKAIVLATEVHRPSFWSLLVHTNKYQRSRAKARIKNNSSKRSTGTTTQPAPRSPLEQTTPIDPCDEPDAPILRRQWANTPPRKPKPSRGGKATKRAPDQSEKKSKSMFQRLLSHLDRRSSKKNNAMQHAPMRDTTRTQSVDVNRLAFSKGSSGCDSDDKTMYADKAQGGFRQSRHSEGYPNRRVVSALTGNFVALRNQPRREMTRVASQDDQYVTFITSEP